MNETGKKTGMLEESPGVISSKRVWGTILLGAGGLLLACLGTLAMFTKIGDPDTTLAVGRTFMATGGALLGIGVFEGLPSVLRGKN
jgi:uncharacterized membrane protein